MTIVLSVWLIHEPINAKQVTGIVMCMSGMAFAQLPLGHDTYILIRFLIKCEGVLAYTIISLHENRKLPDLTNRMSRLKCASTMQQER
jgi:hypothetical protein